jgi:hypothetical protein
MPLRLPDLDDRRYNDLVAEALAKIPAYAPEWTNHNPSDPGITLIELFAYLTDMLLYRLNRVTDDNTRKFLKLLTGQEPSSDADLRQEIRTAVLGIRERYRAVTKDDYEFLSTESFNTWLGLLKHSLPSIQLASIPLVARAHCVPQRNLDAATEAGRLTPSPAHVSVVIVPRSLDSTSPQPSADQIKVLLSYLDERRILTTKLHVTGPFYAPVSAQLVIARNSDAEDEAVTNAVKNSLKSFLNPLPSNNGEGWPFGRDVFVSEVYETLEKIRGVDFITDVMLDSSCKSNDPKCVVADKIWHGEGDLVGLRIQEHHLPVFDGAERVIAPSANFVIVNLSVTAQVQKNADQALLKRKIKSAVREIFRKGPATAQTPDIRVTAVTDAIKTIQDPVVVDPVVVAVDCIPSSVLVDQGQAIHVAEGQVVDWRVSIHLRVVN